MAEKPVVAVLGLGAAGASLTLGLRGSGTFGSVLGWDPDFDVARAAQRQSAADRFVNNAAEAARLSAAVFLALRGEAFTETMTAIGPNLKPGAVVCSMAEAQEAAAQVAARTLPGNVSFVSADPIAWNSPGEAPSGDRFRKGILSIAPLATAHEDAVGFVTQVAETLGMEPFFLDAREHDALAAGLQLLPALVAAGLMRVASQQASWREMSRLAGAAFRNATAPVAEGLEERQASVAASREHLVRWLDLLVADMSALRDELNDGREPEGYFEKPAEARAKWLADRQLPSLALELPEVERPKRRRFPF
jgi:prephenate dehydrogenase